MNETTGSSAFCYARTLEGIATSGATSKLLQACTKYAQSADVSNLYNISEK